MIILGNESFIDCNNKYIEIENDGIKTKIGIRWIDKISILTTDTGPFNDDVALAIFVPDHVYIVKSQHPLYEQLLFDKMGAVFTLDYQAIISASSCCKNAEFIIFSK